MMEQMHQSKHGRITAYIHMDAIRENIERMKAGRKNGVPVTAVIKTDGYGHGALAIAGMLEEDPDIWGYAVAAVSEAKQLRSAGIKKPVLILGYTFEEDYLWLAENEVRPVIFTLQMAQQFADAAKKAGKKAVYHLAVDTGMSRIGYEDSEESLEEILSILKLTDIEAEGIFTHFARADEKDKSQAWRQFERFSSFCKRLQQRSGKKLICHCSNSAAFMELPEMEMDMVRMGISMYGIYPSDEMNRERMPLRPAMELKSHIVHIKEIQPGTAVSYGGTFVAEHPTRIATIPVGYGDGYPRQLSNRGQVLIHGKRADIAGRVCMDQFMVDVTGMDVQVLDEVTLLGRDGEEEITVDELGRLSGRFPYEFVCDIGKRVPRVYKDSVS